ncbi:hypothetical protein [Methylovirgula sp. 4M-Z18]|uniref:hypothetical protein n=1 Tax=Methylovirgula sp. 4M-Z18 TaxID=2293567 RepID=UPI001AEC925F|nr:hypothetical protein [Methylovirgula sp. 4M-Z18]
MLRLALLSSFLLTGAARAAPVQPDLAGRLCHALASAVDAAAPGAPRDAPVFVLSYHLGPQETQLPPWLATSAFVYDNAVAAIALVGCGDVARAKRIADALLIAMARDRTFPDHRVRNAYRAGALGGATADPPGWWDPNGNHWAEDAYQDGSATGNLAWAALALLNVEKASGDRRYGDGAQQLLSWIDAHAAVGLGPAGFTGGQSGFDGAQIAQTWKSTEHNLDVAAAAHWLVKRGNAPNVLEMQAKASQFVASRFLAGPGYFLIGTNPDGTDPPHDRYALDVQVWSVLAIPDAADSYKRAVLFAFDHLRRPSGMTFAGLGEHAWTEGSAQTALALQAIGEMDHANELLHDIANSIAPDGFLYATSDGEVPTGLKVEAQNGADFFYFHRPHLGATAWGALAALGWNPFIGERVH